MAELPTSPSSWRAMKLTKSALFLVRLETKSVARKTLRTVDPTRNQARFDFDNAPVEKLPGGDPAGTPCNVFWIGPPFCSRSSRSAAPTHPANGARLCAGTFRLRSPDRLVPGDQAQAHRCLCRHRTRPVQRLLWRLGFDADAAELPLAAATARVSATEAFHSRPRKTSRPTAASASPGPSTASCTIADRNNWL